MLSILYMRCSASLKISTGCYFFCIPCDFDEQWECCSLLDSNWETYFSTLNPSVKSHSQLSFNSKTLPVHRVEMHSCRDLWEVCKGTKATAYEVLFILLWDSCSCCREPLSYWWSLIRGKWSNQDSNVILKPSGSPGRSGFRSGREALQKLGHLSQEYTGDFSFQLKQIRDQ